MAYVSVVIAAHDEAPAIARVVERCRSSLDDDAEVIVVDDGSTDETAAQAEAAGARVVQLARNRGKGTAVLRGVAAAEGDVLVFLDGDGQDDPREIPRLLAALGPDVGLVIGSRFLGTLRPGAITPLHRLGNRALTATVNTLFRTALTDTQAGFRCLPRAVFDRCSLTAGRYDIEVDLLLAVLRQGERVVEVPVTRHPRPAGRSKLSALRDGTRILARILRHRLSPPRARPATGPRST